MFRKKITVPLTLISIDEADGFHLLLDARLNGQPARLLVDTGASRTVFDKERILRFLQDAVFQPSDKASTGLGTDSMESHLVNAASLQIGDLRIDDLELVVLDLVHVNQSYEKIGIEAIDGVLGSELLSAHKAVIDFGKLELRLSA